jgi:GT2 family glycosyltransferase
MFASEFKKRASMLSVVIPTHQRTDLLQLCLASVMKFTPAGTEVVVVDDASPEGRAGAVARRFTGVKVLRRHRRGGFAAAVNAGIRASTGAVVQLLNDDAEVTRDWAGPALAWFKDPAIAAVAPLVLAWPDGRLIDSAGDRYYLGGVASKRGHGQRFGPAYARPCRVFGASASSGFYRRDALEQVGLFPECFGSYFEDVDLAFRLQRAGYRAIYEPRARVLHRVGASYGDARRRLLLQQQSRNEERVFWRNTPPKALWSALPKHVAVLVGKAWRRWQEGSLLPWAWGRLRLVAEISELRQHRRALEQTSSDPAAWEVETNYVRDV